MGNTSLRQQYHDVPLLHLGTSPHTPCVGACSSYAHSPAATSATSSPVVCSGVSRRGGISGGELQILYCLHCCAVCVWYEYLICNSTSYHLTYINITCITDLSNFFGISIVRYEDTSHELVWSTSPQSVHEVRFNNCCRISWCAILYQSHWNVKLSVHRVTALWKITYKTHRWT